MESTALAPISNQSVAFRSIDDVMTFAKAICKSPFVPKEFRDKPGDVMAAIMYGLEIGISPMSALQNLAVINGKVSVYGDLLLGMCMADPSTEYIREATTEEIAKTGVAWCEAKRKGKAIVRRTFSVQDAEKAGLLHKPGPWSQYRNRMLMMRSRGWTLRDAYADRLKGLQAREEAQDVIDVSPIDGVYQAEPEPQQQAISHHGVQSDSGQKAKLINEISAMLKEAWPGNDEAAKQAKRELVWVCFDIELWGEMPKLDLQKLESGRRHLLEVLYPPTQEANEFGTVEEPDQDGPEIPGFGYEVTSESDPNVRYVVSEKGTKCTCPGFSYRGTCKHVISTDPNDSTENLETETPEIAPEGTILWDARTLEAQNDQDSTTATPEWKKGISAEVEAFRAFLLQKDPKWILMFEDTMRRYPAGISESAFAQTKTNLEFRINKESKAEVL